MTLREIVTALSLAASCVAMPTAPARADGSFVHVVRQGDTLASIARLYYGNPRRESVIVTENGLTAQGGSPIVVGMRLVIPWAQHHVVGEGETWSQIAERYYGDTARTFVLLESNGAEPGTQPDVNAEILVPYPLRHVAGQNETLRRIAIEYFGNDSTEVVRTIRRFNGMRGVRPARGQVVLVPLPLMLSEEGRRAVETEGARSTVGGETRAMQQRIEAELPALREHVRRGRFTEAVALGNRLIGAGRLTGNQIVSIERELGTAYVALDRPDLAVDAFERALRRQPDLELDVSRTSPLVLRAFEEAKERRARRRPAQAPDAGTPPPP